MTKDKEKGKEIEINIEDQPSIISPITNIDKKASKLVILLHGLGSNGEDMISIAPYIRRAFPSYFFVAPNGIEEFDMGNFGFQWFSLKNRDPKIVISMAQEAYIKINNLINEIQNHYGFDNKDTILIGFSQGAMVSLYITLMQIRPFFLTALLNGRMIEGLIKKDEIKNFNTSFAIIHGKEDDVISYDEANKIEEFLDSANIKSSKKIIDNLKHSIDLRSINFLINEISNKK